MGIQRNHTLALSRPSQTTGCSLRFHSSFQSIGCERQAAQTLTSCLKDCVPNCRRNSHDWRFTRSDRGKILSVKEYRLDFRDILESRHAILSEVRIENAPILKLDGFKQRTTNSHNIRALHLVTQPIWIDDRATLKCRHYALDSYSP